MEETGKQKFKKDEKVINLPKNAAELQKIRLDKLMSNPEKPAHIPDASKPYKPREPLEFIRNVWGSSAGAGSGDFHVYRGVRRREYARQKFNKEKNEREDADDAYHKKVEENAKAAEEKTAKKRAKRQKKKQKQKNKKPRKEEEKAEESDEEDEDEEAEEVTDNVTDNVTDGAECPISDVQDSENNVNIRADSANTVNTEGNEKEGEANNDTDKEAENNTNYTDNKERER